MALTVRNTRLRETKAESEAAPRKLVVRVTLSKAANDELNQDRRFAPPADIYKEHFMSQLILNYLIQRKELKTYFI